MRRISAVKDCKAPAERAERANKAIIDLGEIISAQQVLNKLMSWLSGRDTLGRYGAGETGETFPCFVLGDRIAPPFIPSHCL